MAKLTKEEIQALLKVSDYHWYHQEKKITLTGSRSYNDDVYKNETVTHLVQMWNNRPNLYTGKAWSRDEDRAWRNAYKNFIKVVENNG